jgi:hypothetical protein
MITNPELSMPHCCDNDVRWSDGQPFTFVLDLTDGQYKVSDFIDARMNYQVDVDTGGNTTTHHVVWKLVKAILNSPHPNFLTVILAASDPGLSATGHGVGPAKRRFAGGKRIGDSVSGPVATFVAPDPNKAARTAGGSSSSSSSNSSSGGAGGAFAPVSTVQVAFVLAHSDPTPV